MPPKNTASTADANASIADKPAEVAPVEPRTPAPAASPEAAPDAPKVEPEAQSETKSTPVLKVADPTDPRQPVDGKIRARVISGKFAGIKPTDANPFVYVTRDGLKSFANILAEATVTEDIQLRTAV